MKINTHKINKFLTEKLNFIILRGFPRHSIRFAKEYFENKLITVVEIGTYEGYNAKSMLRKLNIQKLYLIDPYENYLDYASSEPETVKILKKAEKDAKKRLNKNSKEIIWVKKLSKDALKEIPDNIDFVYIDGNHDYKYVKEDMENYYKKLKKGEYLQDTILQQDLV
jgi:predicted O-methyltransferase YrrM